MIKKFINTFNPNIPITRKQFLMNQAWIWVWTFLIGIPGLIAEKSEANFMVVVMFVLAILAGMGYIEFILTVKRFRALHIPPIWASLVFIPPLNLLAFLMAMSSYGNPFGKYGKRLLNLVKENREC